MPKYDGKNYSLAYALANIREYFWERYRDVLYQYAQDRTRQDIVDQIHQEWDNEFNMSPFGTDIRIEWALAIYDHGDWEKSLTAPVPDYKAPTAQGYLADPRHNHPKEYRCENGAYVRSVSELCIANWLYFNNIVFEYERSVDFEGVDAPILCDFYIPKEDVYVEYWGMMADERYTQYKEWKEDLYTRNGYKLISLYSEDLKNLRDQFKLKKKGLNKL